MNTTTTAATIRIDALGSRLVAVTITAASRGRSKLPTACATWPNYPQRRRRLAPHNALRMTDCRVGSSDSSISTSLAPRSRIPCGCRATRDDTHANWAPNGFRSPRCGLRSKRLPRGWSMTSGCGRSPYCVRCTLSLIPMSRSCLTSTAECSRRTSSTLTRGQPSPASKSRRYRHRGAKAPATSTNSGTR